MERTSDASVNTLLEAALSYAARGWAVFPCYEPTSQRCSCRVYLTCGKPGKHPRTKNGLSDATTDEAQIRRWWQMWPTANVAIRTGAASGLVVLDVDRRKQGEDSLVDLEHSYQPLPETVIQLTGNGLHYLFAHPGVKVKNGVDCLGSGLDIRGDGGYIIAAPSLHTNGKRYTWEVLHEPDETPLAPLPDWVRVLCQEQARMPGTPAPSQAAHEPPSAAYATELLTWIPNPPANRDCWRDMGMALHSTGAAWAFELWDTWSQQYPEKYDARDQRKTWNSFSLDGPTGRAPITFGTLVHLAKTHGYQGRNGATPGPFPTDPYACPELPASAKVEDERAAEASIFLDDYIAFSKTWAPRAYEGFHEACGLFTLGTTAAHRIKIAFGPQGSYTSLYMALASRTSMFTKTTAVKIAMALLRQAGLQALIADDDATPQAFLRSLTLYVPPDYADLFPDAQDTVKTRLAFAGQKGWFYEEWGQHLHAMMQKEGHMADFRGILKRLDDTQEEYVYSTISRGRDVLFRPYVTLLANVTPADLKPFMRAQSPLWRDGYIARFAFIAPGDVPASTAPFPVGTMTLPRPLVTALASWHKRLGVPAVSLEPISDPKGKATGKYRPVWVRPHQETTYALHPEVRQAYYAYDNALHELMAQSTQEDLDGSYVRFPTKALRIAALLASLHDDSGKQTIWPAQWYRGQQIAERWRRDLHTLRKHVEEGAHESQESKGEKRILAILKKHGAMSATELHRWTKLAHSEIAPLVQVLTHAGVISTSDTGRTSKYALVTEGTTAC